MRGDEIGGGEGKREGGGVVDRKIGEGGRYRDHRGGWRGE